MQSLASCVSWQSRGASSHIPTKVARPDTPSGAERSSSENGTREDQLNVVCVYARRPCVAAIMSPPPRCRRRVAAVAILVAATLVVVVATTIAAVAAASWTPWLKSACVLAAGMAK